jgi:MFS family permease
MGRNLGRVLSVDVAGFALGPIVSAITVGALGLPAPFIVVGSMMVASTFIVRTLGIQEQPEENRTTSRLAFDLLRHKPLAGAIVIGLGLMMMIGTFDSTWSVMMDDLGASPFIANLGISLFALPLVLLGPLGGRLTQKVGPYVAASGGLLCGTIFMTAYGNLPSPLLMLCVGVCHGIVDGLTVTGSGMAVSMVAPQERLASAQGLNGGLGTLMGGVSAIIAGFNYDAFGRRITFAFTAIVMLVVVATGARLAGSNFTMKQRTDDAALT